MVNGLFINSRLSMMWESTRLDYHDRSTFEVADESFKKEVAHSGEQKDRSSVSST
jgi:hypothetical protein